MGMLTERDINLYNESGYVVPDFQLDAEIVEEIGFYHDHLIKKHPEYTDYCPAVLCYETGFLKFARIPEILDMVEQLIGPDFALWNSSFFAKPAKVGSKTPWHQDGEYWPVRPLATCSVWIAVHESTEENGCLRVIPGSHKGRRLKPHDYNSADGLSLALELKSEEYEEASAESIILKAGQISLHDVYLVHGSEPNQSERPRRGMTLRYMPTTSVFDRSLDTNKRVGKFAMSERTLYLMRGTDQSKQNDFRIRY